MSDPQVPADDPRRKLATAFGVPMESGQAPVQGSQVAPDKYTQPPSTLLQAQAHLAQQQRVPGAPDSLSRPYVLPSGGLGYEGHEGAVLVIPMRGEQEEVLAGAGSGLAASPAMRHVVQQCIDTQGIPYERLILEDWTACLLHVLSYSMGEDLIPLYPSCPHCNQQFDGSRPLSQVPCRVLRRPTPGEVTTWPPATSLDEDEDMRVLREMGLEGDQDGAEQVYVATDLHDNYEVTLSNGQRICCRYLRVSDMIQAEDFAQRSGEGNSKNAKTPGARLHSFIMARYISSIDGRAVGVLEAMKWVKQAPMFLNHELRQGIERRSFGYELVPAFRCPNGHSFRQQLPLNGAMFRRRGSATVH